LFMRQDTVAEAIAAHFGVSKSELLDRDTADLPVRMALGETHVIASTKKALGEAGVAVDTLEAAAAASGHASSNSSVARSSTCLLVKNLPFAVTGDELSAMFEAMGGLARLVLPPTRTIALVEYLEAQDAKRAFRTLAYKRCHHVPLYLEWAPAGIFTPGAPSLGLSAPESSHPGNKESTTPVLDSTVVAGLVDAENDEAATGEGGPARELYVKNLNFETRDPALRAHFAAAAASAGGRVTAARVALKGDAKHASRKLSLGYGFVELDSEATARTVLRSLQGSKLDGHALVLQLSTSKSDSKKTKSKSDDSKTKLVCRNVAFEATRKDLSSLFGAVGQLKSLRLPKKFDGTHRGFAFVEFATAQETQAAIDAISGTHLYGRRLLVERAKEDDGLDDIRDKTATKYRADDGTGERPSKRPRQTKGLIADLDNM
jgi:multiple RNA-binding domain-containing protein 1